MSTNSSSMLLLNESVLLVAVLAFAVLQNKHLRQSSFWRATVTPLASIIGSGFLIIAPLMAEVAGELAPLAMASILLVAYGIGAVVRFNIKYCERHTGSYQPLIVQRLEHASGITLSIAYVISIAFYLRLMSAFLFSAFEDTAPFMEASLTTIVLAAIGGLGWRYGLTALERMETLAVSVKLAIIVALLAGLLHHNLVEGFSFVGVRAAHLSFLDQLRMLAGMLLVVQGFETSRYLASEYSPDKRIASMKLAQRLSAVIYLFFIILILPLIHHLEQGNPDETAIIDLSAFAAPILPALLALAAIMSQFSAAVADTVGAGGLLEQESDQRLSSRTAYLGIVGSAIILIWVTDIFAIIAFASRAFALYYLLQTLLGIWVICQGSVASIKEGLRLMCFVTMAGILTFAVLFALPAG